MISNRLDEPAWLLPIAGLICDHGGTEQLRETLARLDSLPFRLFHDWHANTVSPLIIESCSRRELSTREHEEVREMHGRAARADNIAEEAWRRALEPALHAIYLHSYPYEAAFAVAANAGNTYALSHGYAPEGARKYGEHYAELNTGANARLFPPANAKANSRAYAQAFARSDHDLLARAYPRAYLRACVALAGTEHAAVYARLGDGLITSLQQSPRRDVVP